MLLELIYVEGLGVIVAGFSLIPDHIYELDTKSSDLSGSDVMVSSQALVGGEVLKVQELPFHGASKQDASL